MVEGEGREKKRMDEKKNRMGDEMGLEVKRGQTVTEIAATETIVLQME